MLPLALKKLFIYLSPLNYFFGEYNMGGQYLLNESWALDVNVAYIYEQEGSPADLLYNNLFNVDKVLYQGPSLRLGAVSMFSSDVNPLRTDFSELELMYRYLWYTDVDFLDDPDTGKVFNISETMNVVALSWIAGYELMNKNNFKLDGYVGFGLQTRFRNITVNSYGYNYDSNMYALNDHDVAIRVVPMLNAGLRIGFHMLGRNGTDK